MYTKLWRRSTWSVYTCTVKWWLFSPLLTEPHGRSVAPLQFHSQQQVVLGYFSNPLSQQERSLPGKNQGASPHRLLPWLQRLAFTPLVLFWCMQILVICIALFLRHETFYVLITCYVFWRALDWLFCAWNSQVETHTKMVSTSFVRSLLVWTVTPAARLSIPMSHVPPTHTTSNMFFSHVQRS